MTIIKKSGKKEDFSIDKLSGSLLGASKDANTPLDDGELKRIISEFQALVNGKSLITTQQIDIIVYGILYARGLYGVLEKYVSYSKND